MTKNMKGLSKSMKYTAMFFVFLMVFSSCRQEEEEDKIIVPVPTGFSGYIYPNGLPPYTPQFETGYGVSTEYSAHFEWDPLDDIDYFYLVGFTNGRIRWSHYLELKIPGTWTSIDIQGVPNAYGGYPPKVWALNAVRSGVTCDNGIDWDNGNLWYRTYQNAVSVPILNQAPAGQ